MRIRPSALIVASLLAGACALNPNEEIGPAPLQPLDAHVWVGGNEYITFSTNRAAYVAVFEISPYDGVGLLYPQFGGQETRPVSGIGWVYPGFGTHRWAYFSQTGGSLLASTYLGPHYIFMIASDHPLDISDLVARPFALRKMMGYTDFQARHPFETMDQLASMAIRDPNGSRWATDVYMLWPDIRPPVTLYALVNCSGQLIRVPLEFARYVLSSCSPATNVFAVATPPASRDTVSAIAKLQRRPRGKDPTPVASEPSVETQSVDRYLMGREGLADGRRDPRGLRHGVPVEPTVPGRFIGMDGRGTLSFEERQQRVRDARGADLPGYDSRTRGRSRAG